VKEKKDDALNVRHKIKKMNKKYKKCSKTIEELMQRLMTEDPQMRITIEDLF